MPTATVRQIEANRQNARHSTGPKTPAGKLRSSLNAARHYFTAQVHVMPEEEREAHDQFCAELAQSLAPEGAMERQLAQSVAEDSWRLNRGRAIENNIFALGHSGEAADIEPGNAEIHTALTAARVFMENPQQFQLLTLYAQRTNRDIQKNLNLLRQLQAERKERYEREMEQAKDLARLNEMKGIPYQPATDEFDGFVFSNDQIARAIDRERRRKQALTASKHAWNPDAYLKAGGSLAP